MADFVPNTTVKLLENVPLDNTYSDVINFATIEAQTAFFMGKSKYTFTDFTYQRVNSSVPGGRPANTIRVQSVADYYYSINYIMFQNTNFGNKWFYAFVKKVNYISVNTTEIEYELDHYQTWQFNFQVVNAFVEREHTNNDAPYSNRLPEPVEFTEHTATLPLPIKYEERYICMCTATDVTDKRVQGDFIQRVYSGLGIYAGTDPNDINFRISEYASQGILERVVAIYMCPFNPKSPPAFETKAFVPGDQLGAYAPRNKKLLGYPFRYVEAHNFTGQKMQYRIELFNSPASLSFMVSAWGGFNPTILLTPQFYRGQTSEVGNYSESLSLGNFPVCGWTGNVFANWLAQNAASQFVTLGANVATLAGGVATANPALIAAGSIGLATQAGQAMDMYTKGAQAMATPANPSVLWANNAVGFEIRLMSIPEGEAAKIDTFFDMYGYTTNQMKIPNMWGRASWNYVKTNGIILAGSVPVDSMARIKQMFNNGVRFWHGDFVGQYSLPNHITEKGVALDEKLRADGRIQAVDAQAFPQMGGPDNQQ